MINNIDNFMNSLFYSCPNLDTFQTLKFASDETNTEYFTYTSSTIIFGTPDVKWNQICFVFDEDYPLIYTKGKIIYDQNSIIQLINNKIGELGNKVEPKAAVYYTQEEADIYNEEHELQEGDEGFITTENIKTPAVEAVPYSNIMEVLVDNEEVISGALNSFNNRLDIIGALGNKVEAQEAIYYTQEEADTYNSTNNLQPGDSAYVTTETILYPAVSAVPYTTIMEVINDHKLTNTLNLNELDVNKEDKINKTINISYSSTDDQYPSAKAVYTYVGNAGFLTVSSLNGKENTSNKITSLDENSTDTQYPSAKAVYTYVGEAMANIPDDLFKEDTTNKVTYIDADSTDTQYPSAKAVYTYVGEAMANIPIGSDDTKEDIANKVSYIDENSNNIQYPSAYAVLSYVSNAISDLLNSSSSSLAALTQLAEELENDSSVTNQILNDLSSKEDTSNKVTSIDANSTDTQYPSAKAVYSYVGTVISNIPDDSSKEDTSNKVTYIDADSTDTQYPSAKSVYTYVGNAMSNIPTIWVGTQLQYDAIIDKDSSTIYIIQ